jgi:uncharacterized protein
VNETEGNEQPLRVPAWIWNSHESAAFAQAAAGVQRPLLMRSLRQLRGGVDPGAPDEARLAALLRGHRTMVSQRMSHPANYVGFPANKNCGDQLARLAEDAERYLDRVPASRNVLSSARESIEKVVDRRSWSSGTKSGFNDFSEGDLQEVLDALDPVLAILPSLRELGVASEDAPLPFDPRELPDHLDLLSAEEATGSAAGFVANLILRIRSMLADARLQPIVAPQDELRFADWLEHHIGDENAANGQIVVLDLSLVPSDVLHIVIAVTARVVFEALQRYRKSSAKSFLLCWCWRRPTRSFIAHRQTTPVTQRRLACVARPSSELRGKAGRSDLASC